MSERVADEHSVDRSSWFDRPRDSLFKQSALAFWIPFLGILASIIGAVDLAMKAFSSQGHVAASNRLAESLGALACFGVFVAITSCCLLYLRRPVKPRP